jgi:hypothetical protein
VKSGSWDSIHIVEVTDNKTSATYKLTTTVMLAMHVDKQEVGETNWSGSLTRQVRLAHFLGSSSSSSSSFCSLLFLLFPSLSFFDTVD